MINLSEFEKWFEEHKKTVLSPKEKDLSKSNPASIKNILEERKAQRKILFWFSIILVGFSFGLLVTIIIIQSWIRIVSNNANFSLLDEYEMEVLSVAIFGQAIGIIYIITKSLWDDSVYIDKMEK